MLRKIRITVALLLFIGITFSFLDFAQLLPVEWEAFLPQIQFLPALLSLNVLVLAVLLLGTWLLGRVYCSVICPLGVFQDIINWFSRKIIKRKKYGYKPNHPCLRWGIFAVLLIAWLFGFTFLLGLVSPYSMYGRMAINLFQPVYYWANNLLADICMSYDDYTFYSVDVVLRSVVSLGLSVLTLVVIVSFAFAFGRTYCNTVCPVGTLLGYLSKYSLLKIRINKDKCNSCGLCGKKCKAYCIDTKNHQVDYSRCVACFDCVDNCKQHAIFYSLAKKVQTQSQSSSQQPQEPEASRRSFLKTGATSLLMLSVAASGKAQDLLPETLKPAKKTVPITPPGSESSHHLLAHCTSCQLCVGKCPSQVIKPALLEYGIGGIMQPTLSYVDGYCDMECNVCGTVCPTGAIRPLTIEKRQMTQVGYAEFHFHNCIVTTEKTSCGLCSRSCPVGAISLIPFEDDLQTPSIDTSLCLGCGACEYYCPATPFKGISVEGYAVHLKKSNG